MPRKLPWVIDHPQHSGRAVSNKSPKLKKLQTKPPELKHKIPIKAEASKAKIGPQDEKSGRRRSLSSSPSPTLPDVVFMKRGYGADDIYVMVENEFYSVAQSFTAHLHHAAYKRLMQKARNAPPGTFPEINDSMAPDVKQKLARALLEQKQKQVVREMTGGSVETDVDDVGMNDSRLDEPWSGTSLADLMSSGSQQKTSLVGLGGVPSTTRAALGYKKSTCNEPPRPRNGNPTRDSAIKNEVTSSHIASTTAGRETALKRAIDGFVTDEDDTAVPSPRPGKSQLMQKERERSNVSKLKWSFIDDLEDSDGQSNDQISHPPARVRPPPSGHDKSKASEQVPKDKKSRLDEVPVFLAA